MSRAGGGAGETAAGEVRRRARTAARSSSTRRGPSSPSRRSASRAGPRCRRAGRGRRAASSTWSRRATCRFDPTSPAPGAPRFRRRRSGAKTLDAAALAGDVNESGAVVIAGNLTTGGSDATRTISSGGDLFVTGTLRAADLGAGPAGARLSRRRAPLRDGHHRRERRVRRRSGGRRDPPVGESDRHHGQAAGVGGRLRPSAGGVAGAITLTRDAGHRRARARSRRSAATRSAPAAVTGGAARRADGDGGRRRQLRGHGAGSRRGRQQLDRGRRAGRRRGGGDHRHRRAPSTSAERWTRAAVWPRRAGAAARSSGGAAGAVRIGEHTVPATIAIRVPSTRPAARATRPAGLGGTVTPEPDAGNINVTGPRAIDVSGGDSQSARRAPAAS